MWKGLIETEQTETIGVITNTQYRAGQGGGLTQIPL